MKTKESFARENHHAHSPKCWRCTNMLPRLVQNMRNCVQNRKRKANQCGALTKCVGCWIHCSLGMGVLEDDGGVVPALPIRGVIPPNLLRIEGPYPHRDQYPLLLPSPLCLLPWRNLVMADCSHPSPVQCQYQFRDFFVLSGCSSLIADWYI